MIIIPNFAVLEGGDGSGTTTQLSILCDRLKEKKTPFYPTCEPTSGNIGRLIRDALKGENPLKPETLAMLFAADRNEHINGPEGILAHANRGEFVISDRYLLSSLVYQGIECGDELPIKLNKDFPAPEVTIFLDIDPKIAIERMKGRERIEIYEYVEFQEKVRDKYNSAASAYRSQGAKVEIIDASAKIEEVASQVWSIISQMPILKA